MLPFVQCIFIGDCGVGKTTLLKTATHQRMHRLPTVGVDLISYTSDNLRLQCWDTSGQPRFIHVVQMFVKNCSVIVYMFDATLEKSFLSISSSTRKHNIMWQKSSRHMEEVVSPYARHMYEHISGHMYEHFGADLGRCSSATNLAMGVEGFLCPFTFSYR